jgi:hypothetical protein
MRKYCDHERNWSGSFDEFTRFQSPEYERADVRMPSVYLLKGRKGKAIPVTGRKGT